MKKKCSSQAGVPSPPASEPAFCHPPFYSVTSLLLCKADLSTLHSHAHPVLLFSCKDIFSTGLLSLTCTHVLKSTPIIFDPTYLSHTVPFLGCSSQQTLSSSLRSKCSLGVSTWMFHRCLNLRMPKQNSYFPTMYLIPPCSLLHLNNCHDCTLSGSS